MHYGFPGLDPDVIGHAGWGAHLPGSGTGIQNRNELDVWLQYRPGSEVLEGIRFKIQYSDVWQSVTARNPQSELHVVLDYTILLRPAVGD